MKLHTNYVLMGLCLAGLSGPLRGRAATVWNGPLITYTQPAPDPTQAANRDPLTSNVALTRGVSAGLFNGVTETVYAHNLSPANTEWAVGALANYATLTYASWEVTGGGNPVLNLPGQQLVLHLIADDIYLSLKFTSLGGHGAGGFSYQRSTPAAANAPPTVALVSPTNGAAFTFPANVAITATDDDSDGSVASVAFFDGGTLLGTANSTPYTLTASLAVGGHTLTAVATDNLGLSTTSAPVNVTVSAPNQPPSITITNPLNNALLGSPANVTVRASATDPDGSVTNVQFFDGGVSLGNDATSPYSVTARLGLGVHVLTAVASDNFGLTATSAPVSVTLAGYLPPITNGTIAILLQPVATNLAAPDYAISPPGDATRLFVVEQNGLLRVIQNGTLLPQAALDIQSRVQPPLVPTNPNDERGFLGLAFHPGFNDPASPGYRTLYTYNSELIPAGTMPTYPVPTTATNNYKNVVNEWKISATNASVVDPSSRREVISFGKTAGNHNGGTITFGPDGYLYLALGDGGDANDVGVSHIEPGGNAQNLSTPLGKFLRFDPLQPALTPSSADAISANGQYRLPVSNPFQGPGQVPEIYAYGMRNPYRYSFDRLTGDLIHADVGQNNVEEIDRIVLGGNYGWPIKEGDFLFNRTNGPAGNAGTIGLPPGNRSPGAPAGLIDPISGPMGTLEYDHNDGISITGGFVYRGTAIPELYGKYVFGDLALKTAPVRADGRLFYADLQAGTINAFPLPQFGGSAILPNGLTVHGFGQDDDGELYALVTNTSANGTGGIVYKLIPVHRNVPPSVVLTNPTSGASLPAPATVTLQASASDSDGSVTNVQFFDGVTSLGNVTVGPYNLTVGLTAGSHTFTAVASDNQGATTTSTPVTVTVTLLPSLTYVERKLVSDIPGQAEQTDPNLVNPWGMAFSPTGPFWMADNHAGVSTLYNGSGQVLSLVVTISPPTGGTPPGAPTGVVYNNTPDFLVGPGLAARFIFATEDGTIVSWNSGTTAVLKADLSASGAIYKGLALGNSGGQNYLYAANFHAGRVDVFDTGYNLVTPAGSFTDPALPAGFAPFNIQNVGGRLYVAYALQDAEGHDDVAGPGNGFVDVFDTSGQLLQRLASNGPLNSPWGITLAPAGFGGFSQALLIGNFGDGLINAFDPATGRFLGPLLNASGRPIAIQGLWDLKFGNGGQAGDAHTLYFTAGIAGGGSLEDHGLFGSLAAVVPTITSIVDKGLSTTITWAGGLPPFLLQKKLSLSDASWWNLLTTSNRSVTVAKEGTSGFYRLVNQAQTTVLPFTVLLNGQAESPVVATPATALGTLSIEGGVFSYHITFSGLSSAATAAHVHGSASATNSAGVEFPLVGASGTAGTLSGTHTLTTTEWQSITNGLAYVNIHTAPHPGGEIRGQIVPLQLTATLSGSAEVPPVTTPATGSATLTMIGSQMTYLVTYSGLLGAATASHIHGPADTAHPAGVLVPLSTPTGTSGSISGTVSLTPPVLANVLAGMTYINIHTTTNAGGEIRGQITR